MINCKNFYEELKNNNIFFFSGVPDSLLKNFCAYITDNVKDKNHVIAANEGGAIALAAGHYLASGNPGLIYMQNSGQGNAINPLASLADPDVYQIPMLLIIGWRGEPGKKDEPQHVKQGKITLDLLNTLNIPYEILPKSNKDMKMSLKKAFDYMNKNNAPYAIVIKKGTFEDYSLQNKIETNFSLRREDAVKLVVDNLDENTIVVSTTGKTSRELFEYRQELSQGHEKDFLTVGSMGQSSQIALGIALEKPNKKVYCLDGDGSIIMHAGSLAIIGQKAPENYKHILFNNGAHDSVGGQPTAGFEINFPELAIASGYKKAFSAEETEDIKTKLNLLKQCKGPALLEIKVNKGARKDLGRPTTTPIQNKNAFMDFVSNESN